MGAQTVWALSQHGEGTRTWGQREQSDCSREHRIGQQQLPPTITDLSYLDLKNTPEISQLKFYARLLATGTSGRRLQWESGEKLSARRGKLKGLEVRCHVGEGAFSGRACSKWQVPISALD